MVGMRRNKMKKLKRKINLFFRKHYKIYTILILALGIALGCTYDGRGEDNTHYFNIMGHTFYFGFIL
jgi:hypothetical protein